MGAVAIIDTTAGDLKDRARNLARELAEADGAGAGAAVTGVDVVVDPVGGDLADAALRALGEGGRFVVIGFAAGAIPALPANQILLRNRTVVGVDWGAWAMAHGDEQRALLASLLDLVAAGRLDPVAPTTYPLEEAGDRPRRPAGAPRRRKSGTRPLNSPMMSDPRHRVLGRPRLYLTDRSGAMRLAGLCLPLTVPHRSTGRARTSR